MAPRQSSMRSSKSSKTKCAKAKMTRPPRPSSAPSATMAIPSVRREMKRRRISTRTLGVSGGCAGGARDSSSIVPRHSACRRRPGERCRAASGPPNTNLHHSPLRPRWSIVDKYFADELADGSNVEKRIEKAEKAAENKGAKTQAQEVCRVAVQIWQGPTGTMHYPAAPAPVGGPSLQMTAALRRPGSMLVLCTVGPTFCLLYSHA